VAVIGLGTCCGFKLGPTLCRIVCSVGRFSSRRWALDVERSTMAFLVRGPSLFPYPSCCCVRKEQKDFVFLLCKYIWRNYFSYNIDLISYFLPSSSILII
jgi:hypothetical protein